MRPAPAETSTAGPPPKPRLRGVWHQWAFFLAIPLGVVLVLAAESGRGRAAAAVFATSVAVMFGASALYHRPTWSPSRHLWLRRLDHAGIYGLIAGTYTPWGLLVLDGWWRLVILTLVWGGAFVAVSLKLLWPREPKWASAGIATGLGWVGVAAFPELLERAGLTAPLLVVAGGVCYTLGALVYVLGRPNPLPGSFGHHEVFHALVVAAVAFQYASVAVIVVA